jgi:hypothetical protein
VYVKVTWLAAVAAGRARLNPPWGSSTSVPVPALRVGAGDVTSVKGRLFGSVAPTSKPGDPNLKNDAVFAVKVQGTAVGFPASVDFPRVTVAVKAVEEQLAVGVAVVGAMKPLLAQ